MKQTMNVKEIASLTGKSKRTILNWVYNLTQMELSNNCSELSNNCSETDLLKLDKDYTIFVKDFHNLVESIIVKINNARAAHPAEFTFDELVVIIGVGGHNWTLANLLRENFTYTHEKSLSLSGLRLPEVARQERYLRTLVLKVEDLQAQMDSCAEALTHVRGLFDKLNRLTQLLPAPEKPDRITLNEIVREYTMNGDGMYGNTWAKLYREYTSRYSINLMKEGYSNGVSALDYAESIGVMPQLLGLAREIFE